MIPACLRAGVCRQAAPGSQPVRLQEGPNDFGNLLVAGLGEDEPVVRMGGEGLVLGLEPDGKLSSAVFNERGGTSVVTDVAGNVFIAGDQVWIYDRKGKPVGVLEVPERPGSLAFGGADRRTLFIAARTSLYSIRTKTAGR